MTGINGEEFLIEREIQTFSQDKSLFDFARSIFQQLLRDKIHVTM